MGLLSHRGAITPMEMTTEALSMSTPMNRYVLDYDPAEHLPKVQVPVLCLFGGRDLLVPADPNAREARRLLAQRTQDEVIVLPDINHLLQQADSGLFNESDRLEQTISPSVLETVGDWLKRVAYAPQRRTSSGRVSKRR
jgi:alpha-beta hydrolase superfamily lysophospholipase